MSAPSSWSRAECTAAADVLEGAVHLVDDDDAAEVLARAADQWRAQAEQTPEVPTPTTRTATPPAPGQTPSREHLINLCERGVAPEEKWANRDSSSAQRQLGECLALLRAGCEFFVERRVQHDAWWVHVHFRGFDYFEGDYDGPGRLDEERFYVPTAERLTRRPGGDWY